MPGKKLHTLILASFTLSLLCCMAHAQEVRHDPYSIDSIDKLYVTNARLAQERIDSLQRRCEADGWRECTPSRLENVYAFICIYLHDDACSIEHAGKALNAAKKEKNINSELMALQSLVDREMEMGFYKLATQHVMQMRELAMTADKNRQTFYRTFSYIFLSEMGNDKGSLERGIELLDKATLESKGAENERGLLYHITHKKAALYYNHDKYVQAYREDSLALTYLDADEPLMRGTTDKAGYRINRLDIHSLMALTCLKLGRTDEARRHYGEAMELIKIHPDVPDVQENIAKYLSLIGDYAALEEFVIPLIDMSIVSKTNLSLLQLLLNAYLLQGEHDKAIETYTQYVTMSGQMKERTSDCALEEINVAYHTSELQQANERTKVALAIVLMVTAFLVTLFVILLRNHRKLRLLYKTACERIDEFMMMQQSYTPQPGHSDTPGDESFLNDDDAEDLASLFRSCDAKIKERKPFLEKNFASSDLPAFFDMGRHKLEEMLRAGCRTTPGKYLTNLRIEQSISLMRMHEDYSLEAIAEESGFASERSFYRTFSYNFGITPAAYRKRLKKGYSSSASDEPLSEDATL